jgi:hypothetical protein
MSILTINNHGNSLAIINLNDDMYNIFNYAYNSHIDSKISCKPWGNPPQKQSTKGVEFFRSKEGDSINDNIKTQ